MRAFFQTVKQTASEFMADGCMSSAAALAYYSIFAIPALVVLAFALMSYAGVPQQQINQAILERLGLPATEEQLEQIAQPQPQGEQTPQENANGPQTTTLGDAAQRGAPGPLASIGVLGQIVGVGVLLFTATSLFAQLQTSLNRAWGVEPDPDQGGVWRFIAKRAFSLLIIACAVLLLLASVMIGALMNQILGYFQGAAPPTAIHVTAVILDNVLTFVLATLLFALIFKTLPDVKTEWRDEWVGAAATAAMFVVGKIVISMYLQQVDLGASWGNAAGSLIAVLAWFYYTSLIILFGAEFTQVWARQYGHGVEPAEGARWVATAECKRPQPRK